MVRAGRVRPPRAPTHHRSWFPLPATDSLTRIRLTRIRLIRIRLTRIRRVTRIWLTLIRLPVNLSE